MRILLATVVSSHDSGSVRKVVGQGPVILGLNFHAFNVYWFEM